MNIELQDEKFVNIFAKKISNKVINYKNINFIKSITKYYINIFRSAFFGRIFDYENDKNLVVSYGNFIDKETLLKNSDCVAINYKDLKFNKLAFFIELAKAPIYIYRYSRIRYSFKNILFDSYLNSKLIFNYILSNNIKEITFYGYDYDTTFFFSSYFLKAEGIKVNFVSNSGFLGDHNAIVANEIFCRTEIHKQYMEKRTDIFIYDKISIIKNYDEAISDQESHKIKKIAVYTSGYYKRLSHGFSTDNVIYKGIESEKNMIHCMIEYAKQCPEIKFKLFIHLHNNVENIEEACIYYKDFLSLPNVELQAKDEISLDHLSDYDLGICCMSEIFFDRYEAGCKTVLYEPFVLKDFIQNTGLNKIVVKYDEECFDRLDHFLNLNNESFIKMLKSN